MANIQVYLIFVVSNLNDKNMSKKEAEERVEKIKRLLKDYQELAPMIGIDKKTQEKTIDMFLEDLTKALKEVEEYN